MKSLTKVHVLDCGPVDGNRYQVWGEATDPDDTSKVASEFVCSTPNPAFAQAIARFFNDERGL